ncbi:MAG: phosphoribosyltransferase family protein [Pseudomonadota bacterium]
MTYKHGRKIALSKLLGRLLAARLPERTGQPPLLIPVPLHRWRIWQRGFNQAGLLAKELAVRGKGDLMVDGLVRTKQTASLGGLGAKARRRVLQGAISVRPSRAPLIADRHVVLVDDVLTSGATSDACVRVLLGAKAKSVTIACFARVIDRDAGDVSASDSVPENTTPEVITTPGAT